MQANKIAGHGQHSHEVPTTPELVVFIRDGNHNGTSVWQRENDGFYFASHDHDCVEHTERCVLVAGQNAEELGEVAYGCDLESPRGLFLIGVSSEDDLTWLTKGAEILWDSAIVDTSLAREAFEPRYHLESGTICDKRDGKVRRLVYIERCVDSLSNAALRPTEANALQHWIRDQMNAANLDIATIHAAYMAKP